MKVNGSQIPRSSFLSIEKDMKIVIDALMKNERLKRLLHYTTSDALELPNITAQESIELIGKNIKIVPKLTVDKSVLSYIIISFDKFTESSNPEFRDNLIEFDIICHFDQWQLKDFALRPYKIAGEIDSMFNDKKLSGLGKLDFVGATQLILNDEFAGVCLLYQTVHGEEDKKVMPNPQDQEQFLKDFNDYIVQQR